MGESTPLDDRGRFTVEPRYRKLLGRRVVQVWTPRGLLLRPVEGKVPAGFWPSARAASGEREGRKQSLTRLRRAHE